MGLDAYLYYQCPFRPDGDYAQIHHMEQSLNILQLMVQHGVPSVTMRMSGPDGPVEREITRAEAEQASVAMGHLSRACEQCPARTTPNVPGCRARVDYPIDDVALAVLREAMAINVQDFEGPQAAFVWSLVQAGDCTGQRMDSLVRDLEAEPSQVGHTPVQYTVNGQAVAVTPYMLLEHMFFRPFLNTQEVQALREWLRCYYSAVGERVVSGPHGEDTDANAAALFQSSPSLGGLAAFGALVKAAEACGWGLMLDG